MKDDTAEFKPTGRHVRRGHLRGIAGALVPRGRLARIVSWVLVWIVALLGAGALALYGLIASGLVSANLATPYIERAIENRIGGQYDVIIASTSVETMTHGATAVVVHDIRVEAPNGEVIAAAPSAEVELDGSLLSLSPNVWPAPSARGFVKIGLCSLHQRIRSRARVPAKMEIRAAQAS